jgi:hypothetical protein
MQECGAYMFEVSQNGKPQDDPVDWSFFVNQCFGGSPHFKELEFAWSC